MRAPRENMRAMRTWRVGALQATVKAAGDTGFTSGSGESVELGRGVQAIVTIAGKSEIVNRMSPVGQACVIGGMRAFQQLAGGDIGAAITTGAGIVLSGLAYYTAQAISEGTVSVATASVGELASGLSDMVPLLGIYVDLMARYSGSATGKDQGEVVAECFAEYETVKFGTAAGGEILPCDIFMGAPVPDASPGGAMGPQYIYDHDGLRYFGGKLVGRAGGNFAALLRSLENETPLSAAAKAAWPGMGLSLDEKRLLKDLRLGISATYQRPSYVRDFIAAQKLPGPYSAAAQESDGGYSQWPAYIEILWQAWRAGRLPNSYVIWESARTHGGSFKARSEPLAAAYAAAGGAGKAVAGTQGGSDPSGKKFDQASSLVNAVAFGQPDGGQNDVLCATIDRRASQKFFNMLVGWDQFVDTHYVDVPQGNPADNPLTGKPYPGVYDTTSWSDVLTGALVFAALAAGAYYVADPKQAVRTAKALPQLAKRLPKQALSTAQGAGRWALGGTRQVARRLAGGGGSR